MFLGDGMLTRGPRNVWRLRIFLDKRYVRIIERAQQAISAVGLRNSGQVAKPGCVELYSNWKHWICLFPQHGAGPKHLRRIVLQPWQQALVGAFPEAFLTGLIHSDGCRCINRVRSGQRRYEYPRYFFSNHSTEIRELFVAACSQIGVATRSDGPYVVSVARRESVGILDSFIGPKS